MKPFLALAMASLLMDFALGAADNKPTRRDDTKLVERGLNHRNWERTKSVVLPDGQIRSVKSLTVQLGAGLCYRDPKTGAILDSKAIIEPHPNGAVAWQGQVKCAWASNLRTRGALQITTDDTSITGHLLGLALTDASSGQSAMIAEVKNSQGIIATESSVTYRDIMDSVQCDLTYKYHTWGVEQDLTILEMLDVTPQDLNMDPATTRLELFFEIIQPQEASSKSLPVRSVVPRNQPGLVLGAFSDALIKVGSLTFTRGKAFGIQGVPPSVPIGKALITTPDKRTCLVESIEWPAIQPALTRLGRRQAGVRKNPAKVLMAGKGAGASALRVCAKINSDLISG